MQINSMGSWNALMYGNNASRNGSQPAMLGTACYNVNPEDFIEPGMNITGRSDFKKIVDVSDDIRNKMVDLVHKEYITNYGKTDGEERSALIRDYLKSVPTEDKLSVSWTLGQIYIQEAQRMVDAVKAADPGWEAGQPFDIAIITGALSAKSDSTFDVTV